MLEARFRSGLFFLGLPHRFAVFGNRSLLMPGDCERSAERAEYVRSMHANLAQVRLKIDGVRQRLAGALATKKFSSEAQIRQALQAVETNLGNMEARLRRISESDDRSWDACRNEADNNWESLSLSIKRLVSRFSDESTF